MKVRVYGLGDSASMVFEHVDVLGTISESGIIAKQKDHSGVVLLVNPMQVQAVVIRPDDPAPVARDTVVVSGFGMEDRVYVAKGN